MIKKLYTALGIMLIFLNTAYADVATKNPIIQDEGTTKGSARTINFAGTGVSAAVSGGVATVTVADNAPTTADYLVGTANGSLSAEIVVGTTALDLTNLGSTLVGGATTTSDLNLKTTSGIGATGADMHFLVGSNGATEAMTILNSGYVGIGTTGPAQKLRVEYNNAVQDASGIYVKNLNSAGITDLATVSDDGVNYNQFITWNSASAGTRKGLTAARLNEFSSGGRLWMGTESNDIFYLGTNSTTKMVIDTTGNVGIGQTSPDQELEVVGDVKVSGIASPAYYLEPLVGDTWHIFTGAESYLAFSNWTHGIEVLTLNNDNNAVFYQDVQARDFNATRNIGAIGSLSGATLGITGATTLGTSVIIPNGANPTTSTAGQIAVDTSATPGSGIRFYGDAAYTLAGTYTKSFVILNPVATDDYPVWRVPYNITITAIHVLCVGGTNIIGGLDEADANGLNAVAIDADITGTAATNANDDGTLTNPTLDAGDYLNWHTTSISGTPTSVTVTWEFKIDQVN